MNCPGWSSSGGPWITPAYSMKQLTWSELLVRSGRKTVVAALAQPYTKLGYYRGPPRYRPCSRSGHGLLWRLTLRGSARGLRCRVGEAALNAGYSFKAGE